MQNAMQSPVDTAIRATGYTTEDCLATSTADRPRLAILSNHTVFSDHSARSECAVVSDESIFAHDGAGAAQEGG